MARYHFLGVIVALLATASGCTQLLGLDEVSNSETEVDAAILFDASAVDAPKVSVDASIPDANTQFLCSDVEISTAIGTTAVNTEPLADSLDLSCNNGISAPDQLFEWQAPVTDYFVFDTSGSTFDTVLGIFDACDGSELACNNNLGQLGTSKLVARIERDEKRLLVVDGFGGDQGVGNLNISRVSCPDTDLQSLEGSIGLTTLGFGDDQESGCGGQGREDRAYHWVAPRDGLFAFQVRAAGFRPVVSIQDGPQCSDSELGCNAAADEERLTEVTRRVVKDQTLSISVDGVDGAGEFALEIVDRSASACPQSDYVDSPNELFATRTMSPSCGFPELYGEFGIVVQPGDRTYSFNMAPAPQGGSFKCTFEIQSEISFVVSVLDQDDCGGNEIQCIQSVNTGQGNTNEATLQISATDVDQNLTVVISAQDDRANSFSIVQGCAGVL